LFVQIYSLKAEVRAMKIIFHEAFYQVYASDPAASAGRMEAIMEEVGPAVEVVQAIPATEKQIAAVHTRSHMEYVKSHRVYEVAALAAGGAVMAAEIGLTEPCFGMIRPPGHHASSDSAWGFCYFNNMAIALFHLKEQGKINTAYVLDIDLHFGDGNVNILGGKKWVTVHNVSAGERDAYLQEVRDEMDRCEAAVIGISAGFDNHEDDWGATLKTADYREIGRLVRGAAKRKKGGCFAILEGGYNHSVLGRNALALIEGLSQG
jgi:acetoin utilization deacetylase AcuC-like enzyme